jgi:hypothetical protein
VDIEQRVSRIRWSIDVQGLRELYTKSLEDILGDSNNILRHADKFRVCLFFAF